jgi:hypothetical protein
MRRTLEAGIASVRDAGGSDAGIRQAVEEGAVLGPTPLGTPVRLTAPDSEHDSMCSGQLFRRRADRVNELADGELIKEECHCGQVTETDR